MLMEKEEPVSLTSLRANFLVNQIEDKIEKELEARVEQAGRAAEGCGCSQCWAAQRLAVEDLQREYVRRYSFSKDPDRIGPDSKDEV